MWQTGGLLCVLLALSGLQHGASQDVLSLCADGVDASLGDSIPVCIAIGAPAYSVGGSFSRGAYDIEVDEFSRMVVENSWATAGTDPLIGQFGDDVTIHVQVGGKKSFQKLFRHSLDGQPVTFPYMTIIIDLQDGKVENLVWDDGCHFCSSNRCIPATRDFDGNVVTEDFLDDCYLADEDCITGTTVSEACTLTVYVVFAGTDSNGIAMESANLRFSRFREGALSDFADDQED